MQRAAYLISLAANAVEASHLAARGGAQVNGAKSVFFSPNDSPLEEHLASNWEGFLESLPGAQSIAALVLPNSVVSFRRLEFSFSNRKKITQALPFELENELLADPSAYRYEFEIVPGEEGHCEVMVYLVEKAVLERLAQAAESRQVILNRVTFSAHALAEAMGRSDARQCLVYIGSDEAFIARTDSGRLTEVSRMTASPGSVLESLEALGLGGPREVMSALFKGGDERFDQEALLARLKKELELAREEANRFIRINGGDDPGEITVHGLFNRLFEVRSDTGSLSLNFDPEKMEPVSPRPHFGILSELLGEAQTTVFSRGLNFFKRVSTWRVLLRDLKWPVAAAAVLLALAVGLAGGGFYIRAAALKEKLRKTDAELAARLKIQAPLNSFVIRSALGKLEQELGALKKEREAAAYLDEYHYETMRLFLELSNIVRENPQLTVDSLSFNRNRFSISGTTETYNISENLKNKVGSLERFNGWNVKMTNSRSAQTIRYRLSVER